MWFSNQKSWAWLGHFRVNRSIFSKLMNRQQFPKGKLKFTKSKSELKKLQNQSFCTVNLMINSYKGVQINFTHRNVEKRWNSKFLCQNDSYFCDIVDGICKVDSDQFFDSTKQSHLGQFHICERNWHSNLTKLTFSECLTNSKVIKACKIVKSLILTLHISGEPNQSQNSLETYCKKLW